MFAQNTGQKRGHADMPEKDTLPTTIYYSSWAMLVVCVFMFNDYQPPMSSLCNYPGPKSFSWQGGQSLCAKEIPRYGCCSDELSLAPNVAGEVLLTGTWWMSGKLTRILETSEERKSRKQMVRNLPTSLPFASITPWKLTYPLKIGGWKMIHFLLKWSLF